MIVFLCAYALRRVATAAASAVTSGARVCSVHNGVSTSFASKTTSSPVSSSVKPLPLSGATSASVLTEPYSFRDIGHPVAAILPTAAAASPSRVSISRSTAALLSVRQLQQCKGSAGVALVGEKGIISLEFTTGRRTDVWHSSGFRRSMCGACRHNVCGSRGNAEVCSRSDDSTRCSITASSTGFINKWSGRGWNSAMMRTVGRKRRTCINSTENLGFIFRTTASVDRAPVTSATRGEDDVSDVESCSTSSSRPYHPSLPRASSSSSSSPSACLPRRILLSTLLGRAVQQREIRTTAARLAVSAQSCTTGARLDAEGDWRREEEQRFFNVNTSSKAEETVSRRRQQRDGRVEAFNWDFAQVRRVPPASERAGRPAGAAAAVERTEDTAAELAARSTRNRSVAGKGSHAQEAATRKDVPPSGSRSRRSSTSERRAPPLLRVTDAAAGRIREIVEMYNREAALAESRDGATLRNGSTSPRVGRSNDSSEVQQGANGRRRAVGIRIGLKKRGCSGLSYTVEVATCEEGDEWKSGSASAAGQTRKGRHSPAATSADEIVETKGGTVVLAGDAIMFLVGTELDFIDTELERKFVFKNPNEKQACGCGKSFTV